MMGHVFKLSKLIHESKILTDILLSSNGNGGLYQDLVREYAEDANVLNATGIWFNYRGVGQSEPDCLRSIKNL